MIQLEKTDAIIAILDKTFTTIRPLHDDSDYEFRQVSELIDILSKSHDEIISINIEGLRNEIWDFSSSTNNRTKSIKKVLNRFENLMDWKYISLGIEDLNKEVINDIDKFVIKQRHISRNYTSYEKNSIVMLYLRINQHFFKSVLDLKKLIEQFDKMVKLELLKNVIEVEEIFTQTTNKLSIDDNNTTVFADVLMDLYTNKFYPSIDKSVPLTQENVLLAFAEFIQTEYDYKPSSNTVISTEVLDEKAEVGKAFPDFLLYKNKKNLASALKREFSTEKGKAIRLLLEVLRLHDKPLISIAYRKKYELYKSMVKYFDRDIGKYQSVFDYKISHSADKNELEAIAIRLNHIIDMIEKE